MRTRGAEWRSSGVHSCAVLASLAPSMSPQGTTRQTLNWFPRKSGPCGTNVGPTPSRGLPCRSTIPEGPTELTPNVLQCGAPPALAAPCRRTQPHCCGGSSSLVCPSGLLPGCRRSTNVVVCATGLGQLCGDRRRASSTWVGKWARNPSGGSPQTLVRSRGHGVAAALGIVTSVGPPQPIGSPHAENSPQSVGSLRSERSPPSIGPPPRIGLPHSVVLPQPFGSLQLRGSSLPEGPPQPMRMPWDRHRSWGRRSPWNRRSPWDHHRQWGRRSPWCWGCRSPLDRREVAAARWMVAVGGPPTGMALGLSEPIAACHGIAATHWIAALLDRRMESITPPTRTAVGVPIQNALPSVATVDGCRPPPTPPGGLGAGCRIAVARRLAPPGGMSTHQAVWLCGRGAKVFFSLGLVGICPN